jgi:hypothetical protein
MTVSRRVAQIGLGAAVLILLASMAIVFVGSTQGKTASLINDGASSSYAQHPGQ